MKHCLKMLTGTISIRKNPNSPQVVIIKSLPNPKSLFLDLNSENMTPNQKPKIRGDMKIHGLIETSTRKLHFSTSWLPRYGCYLSLNSIPLSRMSEDPTRPAHLVSALNLLPRKTWSILPSPSSFSTPRHHSSQPL